MILQPMLPAHVVVNHVYTVKVVSPSHRNATMIISHTVPKIVEEGGGSAAGSYGTPAAKRRRLSFSRRAASASSAFFFLALSVAAFACRACSSAFSNTPTSFRRP